MNGIHAKLEQRRIDVAQVAENSARTARLMMRYRTTGAGEFADPKPVDFGMKFIQQPAVSTGVVLAAGQHLRPQSFPQVTVGVAKWVVDAKGLYSGAYLFFVIDMVLPAPIELEHMLTFEAVAIKLYPVP